MAPWMLPISAWGFSFSTISLCISHCLTLLRLVATMEEAAGGCNKGPTARAVQGMCFGMHGGKQCPSASAVCHHLAATCRLCNGTTLIAEVSSTFGKAQLCVNRLCETPASHSCFIPVLYSADSSQPAGPFGAAARSAGTWPKTRVNISVLGKGAAAAPPSPPLLLLQAGGRAPS